MKIDIQMNYDENGRIDNMLFTRVDDINSGDYQFENVTMRVAEVSQILNKQTGELTKSVPIVWNLEALRHNKNVYKRELVGGESDGIGEGILVLLKKEGSDS